MLWIYSFRILTDTDTVKLTIFAQTIKKMVKKLLSLFFLALVITAVKAQDAHYWSSNYGVGGFFTPGAVVAYNGDSGVLFYNPALLAYSKKNSASISGTIYNYNSIKINDAIGKGSNLKSTGATIIPQMVSSTLSYAGITLGYALTHTPVMDFKATQERDGRFNVLNDGYSSGHENFLGQYSLKNFTTETGALLSVGFRLSPKLAFGITAEGNVRTKEFDQNYHIRAIFNVPNDLGLPPFANVEEEYRVEYYHVGIKFKAGLAYEPGAGHHFGLLISSPLLRVAGKGTITADDVASNVLIAPPPTDTINFLAHAYQKKLKAKFKAPVSIAAGYTYDYSSKGQIALSAEYFANIKEYNIITPRNEIFVRSDALSDVLTPTTIKFKDARKAVVNFGIGFSHQLKKDVQGYVSLRTDHSYRDKGLFKDDDGYTGNTSDWNQYHTQIGANIKKRKFNLRVGALLTYGSTKSYQQYINLDTSLDENLLVGDPGLVKATHFSAGILFSYIHNL